MQLEMLNILWMGEIFFLDIIPRVILFPMMNLILVLIVSVVPWPHAEIRQLDVLGVFCLEFLERDLAVLINVEHVKDCLHDHLLFGFADVLRGRVREAVGAADVGTGPDAGAVIVVQVEEGCCVEAGDVMFLCDSISIYMGAQGVGAMYQPCVESPSLRLARLRFANDRRHALRL